MTISTVSLDLAYMGLYVLGDGLIVLCGLLIVGAVLDGMVSAIQILIRR